jgi:molybdenum cofactor cytidylyltransferase
MKRSGESALSDDVRVLGVVLAAGLATRMRGSKVVRTVGGRPMVQRVVDACLSSRLCETLVVVGHDADSVRAALVDRRVRVVHNRSYADGLSTSLRAALDCVAPDHEAALFLHADQPFVTSALIDALLQAFLTTRKPIVRPELDGRPGNPVLFSAALFPELRQETGDRGGRRVIERHLHEVGLVAVDDPLLCLDIDSMEDYAKVSRGV